MKDEINISDLKKIFNDVILIDIRNSTLYNNSHIGNSINVPYQQLISNPKKYLNFNDTYYVYCQQGVTSKRVSNYLRKYGYKVINVKDGYEGWVLEN